MFALFCIFNICKLLCFYVKGILLNKDLMMMMNHYIIISKNVQF